jgi:hypothetical protein
MSAETDRGVDKESWERRREKVHDLGGENG